MAIIKYLLSIALLVFVWKNAHWTVALAITMNSVSIDMLGQAVSALAELVGIKVTKKVKKHVG